MGTSSPTWGWTELGTRHNGRVFRHLRLSAGAALLIALLAACNSSSSSGGSFPTVWPTPTNPAAAAQAAGLPLLDREMLEVHYHAHLDVFVRGQRITVPANIGIDVQRQRITALHTHDTTGIVHIESERNIPFTLSQFFTEWGQPLTVAQVGPVVAGENEQVRLYRNGELTPGDPAQLRFAAHDEIVVWLGPANEQPEVPASYNFPEGL